MEVSELPRPVAFVLGGGGSLGAVQVGMLRALGERGVAPDLVVGTSVGALNGVAVALDPEGAVARLAQVWARVTRRRVFSGGLRVQVRTFPRAPTHLFSNSGLAAVIADFLGPARTFADLALPFAAVAMDVDTTRPHVLREGPLVDALLASAAIPGLFPPVRHGDRRLYDGAIVANVPVRQALAEGARSLVVLDCNPPGHPHVEPRNLSEVIIYTARIAMHSQVLLEAPAVAAEVPVVYLPGPTPSLGSPLVFKHSGALIDSGYETASVALEGMEIAGPGLYGIPWLTAPEAVDGGS